MKSKWSAEMPTEAGLYWLYGWTYTQEPKEDDPAKMFLIEVWIFEGEAGDRPTYTIYQAGIINKGSILGVWKKAKLPTKPLIDWNTLENKSLWGDLSWVKPVMEQHKQSPFFLLSEQGRILAELTKGALYGKVSIANGNAVLGFTLLFTIEAHAIRCSYPLFRVVQTKNIYPLNIMYEEGDDNIHIRIQCNNKEEFEENLKKLLSSNRTLQFLALLQSQLPRI